MEYTTLGASGLTISRIGFGGCPLGGHGWGRDIDHRDAERAVHRAIDLGITFFDTADVYGLGESERLLGKALDSHRYNVTIATKFGVRWDQNGKTSKDISPHYLRTALSASLKRLNLDCIPLYYVHWPDNRTAIEDVIAELQRCQQVGDIKAFGLSNFSSADIAAANRIADVAALQIQYSLLDRDVADAVCDIATKTNTPFVTWGSLSQGLLTGKFNDNIRFDESDRRHRYDNFLGPRFHANLEAVRIVCEIAREHRTTAARVAIRWLLDQPNVGCVLVGAKRPSQIEDTANAASVELTCDDLRRLNECIANRDRRLKGSQPQAA